VTGQDHLGTIAPGESLYAEQIPGITNVTARARYYSFYPWFFRELEKRRPTATAEDLIDAVRRAECLFALVGAQHARVLADDEARHGATMVGRDKLVPALEEAGATGSSIPLANLAAADGYFKNALGGLGQYYFGALRELGILGGDTRTRDIRYTNERGLPLAEAFGGASVADRFFALLGRASVSVTDLDELAPLCPCGLGLAARERRGLIDLVVDPKATLGDEARTRRGTIALVLDLVGRQAAPDYDFAGEFRASTYSGALFDRSTWQVPAHLTESMRAWSTYGRHELLSVAFQGLFWAALQGCEMTGRRTFRDARELAAAAIDELAAGLGPAERAMSFSRFVATLPLPAMTEWAEDSHEMQAAWRILSRDATPRTVAANVLHLLGALVRRSTNEDPYVRLHFEAGYFERYPINLRSFLHRAQHEWATLDAPEAMAAALRWALATHWRVAMQKLGDAAARDTFKVRPLEGSVVIVDAPAPTFSVPRIHRVLGILRDLGIVDIDANDRPVLTTDGRRFHGELLGG
jgi:hypothetical protein